MKTCALLLLLALPLAAQYREQIEVRVIDVDVVVTDRQGRPITDLTRDDFELLEDGRPVEIRYFSRVVDGQLMDVPPLPQAESSTVAATETAPAAPSIPLTWVVFLDQTSIPMRYRTQTLGQLRTFLDRAMAGGDRAIIANNDGMVFKIQQTLTNDKGKVLETVKKLQKSPVFYGPALLNAVRIKAEIGHADPDDRQFAFIGQEIGGQISMIIEEEAKRTRHAILAMNALVDLLGHVDGRMAVVYAGSGFDTLPGLALTEMWRVRWPTLARSPGAPRPEDQQPRVQQDVTRLYQNLSTSRISVYSVYAGESTLPTADDVGGFMDGGRFGDRAALTEATLAREMADRTGGLFFKTNSSLADQLEAMRRDLNNYYSLGYVPKSEPGKQHRVHIKVKREGARARHRESVRELTRQEEAARAAVVGAIAPPPPVVARVKRTILPASQEPPPPPEDSANPLGVAVSADRPRQADVGRDRLLPFELTLNLEALTFREVAGVLRADFLVHFVVTAPDGSMWPVDIREHSLTIPNDEAPKEGQHVSYSWNVDLSPLRLSPQIPIKKEGMQLIVTVEDRASGRQSIVRIPIPR